MDMADTCRVCLCGHRRLHAISNTSFQEMWEKLTNAEFNTNDGKSLLVCYLCCAQLRRSHQLMKRALEANKLLTDIVNSSEQSRNALLLLASYSFGFDYKYTIAHQYVLECEQVVRNMKKENEEDNEDLSVINIKQEEEGDSAQEDNLNNTDDESGAPLEDNTLLKEILEREVRIVVERIDLGTSARKRTLNEVHQRDTKRVKLDETTEDRHPLSNTVSKLFPKRNRKMLYKSFSKESSVNSDVKSSKNKLNIKSVFNRHQGNRISPKVSTAPKHKIQVKNVVARNSETSPYKVVCNNAENETFQPCLPKSVDEVASNSHLRQHTEQKPYECNLCDYRCSHKCYLGRHIKYKHTKEKNFSCHMCQYKCVTKDKLSRHLRKHTGEKPYKCDVCDYRCSQRGDLNKHTNYKHTKEMNFSCDMCQYKCVTKGDLSRHLRKHTGEKPYECDLCDYRCSRKDYFETHRKYKHTKEKNLSCHMCQYKCITKSNLSRHLREHTGEKPYECDLCDYRCSRKGYLETHRKYKHTKEKNFSCHMCQYKCVTKSKLSIHLCKHTGEKPYECYICEHRFSHKSNLNKHILSKHTK